MKFLLKRWRIILPVLILLGLGIGLLAYLGSPSETLVISPDYASTVTTNEPFNITLNIRNTTSADKAIISLGIEQNFLAEGIQVERTVPNYRTVSEGDHWREYRLASSFLPPLAPDEELPLRLTLIAPEPGTYATTLTIWVENEMRPHTIDIEFEVIEE